MFLFDIHVFASFLSSVSLSPRLHFLILFSSSFLSLTSLSCFCLHLLVLSSPYLSLAFPSLPLFYSPLLTTHTFFSPSLSPLLLPSPSSSLLLCVQKEGASTMVPTLLIQHDNLNPDQDQAIAETIQKLKDQVRHQFFFLCYSSILYFFFFIISTNFLSFLCYCFTFSFFLFALLFCTFLTTPLFSSPQGAPVLAILPGAETGKIHFFFTSTSFFTVSTPPLYSLSLLPPILPPSPPFSPPPSLLHLSLSLLLLPHLSGVELAERIAARYGTRNNGEKMTHARRNKFDMQEVSTFKYAYVL